MLRRMSLRTLIAVLLFNKVAKDKDNLRVKARDLPGRVVLKGKDFMGATDSVVVLVPPVIQVVSVEDHNKDITNSKVAPTLATLKVAASPTSTDTNLGNSKVTGSDVGLLGRVIYILFLLSYFVLACKRFRSFGQPHTSSFIVYL